MARPWRPAAFWLAAVAVCFVAGVVAGSLAAGLLPGDGRSRTAAAVSDALERFRQGQAAPPGEVARRSAAFNARTALLLWALGLTVWGIPGVLAVVAGRGFVVGFAVSFLVQGEGWRGLLFAAAALLPSHVVAVPLLLFLATVAVAFARFRREARLRGARLAGAVGRYTAVAAAAGLLLTLAGLLDGYAGRPLAGLLLGGSPPPLLYSS